MTSPEGAPTETVQVARHDLRQIFSLIVGMMLGGLLTVALFAIAMVRVNDLVRSEDREDDREEAEACIDQHDRYHEFERLARDLTEAGATVGADAHLSLQHASPGELRQAHALIAELVPATVQPLLDRYPAPSCDVAAAERLLARD